MQAAKLLAAAGSSASKLYAEDVFSAYTYTGNGSTQTITNGIDLAGKGGITVVKARSNATPPVWQHEAASYLRSDSTSAAISTTVPISAFNSDGFSLSSANYGNGNGTTLVAWTFRNADKFYNHTTVVKTGGSNATVSFANLTTLGMVRVKRTDSIGSWYIWHRSLTAGKLLIGETTAAEATLGHITVSGTTVTLVNGTIADGTYLVEGFAHDTGTDGLIQCGSFTTDGSGNATVSLGWEPQFMLHKTIAVTGDWYIRDSMRGFLADPTDFGNKGLYPNLSNAEATSTFAGPTAVGFRVAGAAVTTAHIYLAIRRPNKPPTTGTQVYNAIARTGTGAAATVTGVGFAPDLVWQQGRDNSQEVGRYDRLRGANKGLRFNTDSEASSTDTLNSFLMDGFSLGTEVSPQNSGNTADMTFVNWCFRRAPGVFDVVCWTCGTASNRRITHGLTVAPELVINKCRSTGQSWYTYSATTGRNKYLELNTTSAGGTSTNVWGTSDPTATDFGINEGILGIDTATYVAYLFATLAGISKVGSYTGNGSSQTINCGFTTGARFILIKRTDSTGGWFVWDTTRGVIAGNDPHLSLNTTAAEVTTDDSIDPDTSGFIVNQLAATNINVTSATYIFLAFA